MKIENLRLNKLLVFLFVLLLPTQLGRHFFFPFSYLSGVRVDYLAPTIYLTDTLALLLIFFNLKTVINFFENKKVLFVLSLLLINVMFSLSPFVSMYQYIKTLEWLGIFSIFYGGERTGRTPLLQGLTQNKNIFLAFFCGAVFQLFLVVWQFISKHSIQGFFWFFGERYISLSMPGIAKASIQGIEFLRPYGTFSHPNSLGGFYLLVYVFFLTNKNIKNVFIKNLFLLVCSMLIFVSFSKIAILTLLFLNIFYLLIQKGGNHPAPTRYVCKPCFFAKIFTLFVIALIFLSAQTDPSSLQNRLALIKNSLQIIAGHLFFGVGLGNYLIAQNKIPMHFNYFFQQPVHNIFLLFISETGIIISLIIGWLITRWFKNRKLLITDYLLLITIFITGFFDHYWLTLQQNFLLLAVILGVSASHLLFTKRVLK